MRNEDVRNEGRDFMYVGSVGFGIRRYRLAS